MVKTFPVLLLLLLLIACQSAPAAPTPIALPAATPEAAVALTEFVLQTEDTLAVEEAGVPLGLAAPAINFAAPVETMGWHVAQVEGERKAVWEVPQSSVGWHLNSARPGTAGNMVFSGHHLAGTAIFAPLARGEVAVGDPLLITDDQGRTFLYQVSEVGDPIPAIGGTREEQQRAADYLAASTEAKLTLVTGWPDFSDTHYLFIMATYLGIVQ